MTDFVFTRLLLDLSCNIKDQHLIQEITKPRESSGITQTNEGKPLKESKEIREQFIHKVFGIVIAQILFSIFTISVIFGISYLLPNAAPGIACVLGITGILGSIILAPITVYYSRSNPANYYLLLGFTSSISFGLSAICILIQNIGMLLVIMAFVLFLNVILYFVTKRFVKVGESNVSGWTVFYYILLIMIFLALVFIALGPIVGGFCVFAIFYSFLVIADITRIIGNEEYNLNIDDYIFAALVLYIDFIIGVVALLELFIIIAKICSKD